MRSALEEHLLLDLDRHVRIRLQDADLIVQGVQAGYWVLQRDGINPALQAGREC